MALWRCGVVALWRCGVVAVWRCGVVALWRCGVTFKAARCHQLWQAKFSTNSVSQVGDRQIIWLVRSVFSY